MKEEELLGEAEIEEEEYRLPVERSEEASGKNSCSPAMVMVSVVILVVFVSVSAPLIHTQRTAVARTKAIGNLKQMGLALLEFDREYGSFPSEETAKSVRQITETELDLTGSSSNALLRQLIAYGVQSEMIFWCRHPELSGSKPDNKMTPREALVAGEVGYSYLPGFKADMNHEIPVLLAPMKIGTETFHSDVFGGKAVFLRLDNSAKSMLIWEDGTVMVSGGSRLFDPAWELWPEDYTIDLRHPEK